VVEKRRLWNQVPLLVFEAPEMAQQVRPGRFVLIRDPSTFDPYLPQVAWLWQAGNGRAAFTLEPEDAVAQRTQIGDWLHMLGPLGQAVEVGNSARRILLVGAGIHTAPLVAIAHAALASHLARELVLVSQADGENEVMPPYLMSPEIEYRVAARNESTGKWLTSELVAWADRIIASGTSELYHHLAAKVRQCHYRLVTGMAQVCVHVEMPCGVGACYACALHTSAGVRLACTDGPWFDLAEWGGQAKR
jgi:dihydroorotate dehydrogenase electron transfer subunit